MNVSQVLVLSIIFLSSIVVGVIGLQYYYDKYVYFNLKYETEQIIALYKSIVNVISSGKPGSFPVRLSFGRLSLMDEGFILINFNDRCLFAAKNYALKYACNLDIYTAKETLIFHGSLEDFSFSILGVKNNIFLRFKPLVKISENSVVVSCIVFYRPSLDVIVDDLLDVAGEVEYFKYTFSPMYGGTYVLEVVYGSSADEFDVYASPENPLVIVVKVLKIGWG